MIHRHFLLGLFAALATCQVSWADDVRYSQDANGNTVRETRRVVKRPVSETSIVESQQTVYTDRVTTEYQPSTRTLYSPVTEYAWEPYLANRWNPLAQPSVQYRYVPHTRWEMRTEETHVPVTRRELVPETRISRVPVTATRFVDEEQTTRMVMNGPDPFNNTAVAARPIGGQSLANDPPKQAGNSYVDRR